MEFQEVVRRRRMVRDYSDEPVDHRGDPRQVEGASTGLTHTLGGNTATVVVSLFGRD